MRWADLKKGGKNCFKSVGGYSVKNFLLEEQLLYYPLKNRCLERKYKSRGTERNNLH